MNTKQIEIFLSVAETLSFTQTSDKLYMSQATISRNISAFEEELGFRLFYRDNKTVRLTQMGEIMVVVLRNALNDINSAVKEARNLKPDITGSITIGVLNGQMLDDEMRRIITDFEYNYPNISVNMKRCGYRDLYEGIKNETIDIIEMFQGVVMKMKNVDYKFVNKIDTLIIMPANHTFAGKEDLTLNHFRDDVFIIPSKYENPVAYDKLLERCKALGFKPEILIAPDDSTQQFWIETGKGLSIANPNHMMAKSQNVSVTQIPEYPPENVVVAWKKDARNPIVKLFIEGI